jgi:formamidopyrimidine-DNA glycosylase
MSRLRSAMSRLGSPATSSRDTVIVRSTIRHRHRPPAAAATREFILPEGHTIHRLAREFKRTFGGQVLAASSPQGRFADAAALLDGTMLERTDAYGKHLFLGFAARRWLHIHLGLYGKWTVGSRPEPEPRGALRLRLVGVEKFADLRGPTACELITPAEKALIQARLGPDPLRRGADPAPFQARLARSRVPVAALLMDQQVVAGIGNVYRAEVLFRQRVPPYAEGRLLHPDRVDALWTDLSALLAAGVRAGRIVTTRPEDRVRARGRVRVEDAHYVYRRAGLPCRVCGTKILTDLLVGRNLFWCPHCQGD